MTRDAEIQRIMKEHFTSHAGHDFEVRGPLALSQVQREYVREDVNQADSTEDEVLQERLLSEDPDWKRFISRYRRGGELYYFKSDERSWAELHGIEGYAVVQKGRIASVLVTRIS